MNPRAPSSLASQTARALLVGLVSCGLPAAPALAQPAQAEPTRPPSDQSRPADPGAPGVCLRIGEENAAALATLEEETPYRAVRVTDLPTAERCVGLFADEASARATLERRRLWTIARVATPHRMTEADFAEAARGQPVFSGPPIGLLGNVQLGPSRVVRGDARDVLAVFYIDSFETEPWVGELWVFDGDSDRLFVRRAWDFELIAQERQVIYASHHVVRDNASEDEPIDLRAQVAEESGMTVAQIDAAVFGDGFAGNEHVVQPVVIDLEAGSERALPLAGGGTLAASGESIVGLMRPAYWELSEWSDPAVWYRLDLEAPAWVPLETPPDLTPSGDDAPPPFAFEERSEPEPGEVFLATRSGNMGLLVVGEKWTVQAARWSAETERVEADEGR